ncbi:polyprenyl diphosphate synthase [Treponema pedis]|uniref:Isoprenyl transferase n=1 Tax=Treponema pedis TaxID=409322 RepID=A0A7S7AWB2_9SPIR|nr:polyprenyl diphosphate synthase [Treponema pedis]QOW59956.1 di-trans,poly-cis-decaprenylcistransferase [Treponema pedis]QSI05297.1 di-trans,poly-cis-decaprenylcistransferase [Treponema pedis]
MLSNPKHIAIVMDGNGRWAKNRGLPRTAGHDEGLKTVKKIVKAAAAFGIPYITLYIFSTENWKRTEQEVGFLMGLIKRHLRAEFNFYAENNLRVLHIGDIEGLPKDIQKEISDVKEKTSNFSGTSVVLAINYGGQDEIIRAIKKLSVEELNKLDTAFFSEKLDTAGIPPVDLFIRTSGEKRLSNFLLWQSAYSELFFSEKLWPDWTEQDLYDTIEAYKKRDRRFGKA